MPRSLLSERRRGGWFKPRLSEVERTTPAAPSKERDHLLDGAATPPLPRRGLRLSRRLSQTPVSSGRLSTFVVRELSPPPSSLSTTRHRKAAVDKLHARV